MDISADSVVPLGLGFPNDFGFAAGGDDDFLADIGVDGNTYTDAGSTGNRASNMGADRIRLAAVRGLLKCVNSFKQNKVEFGANATSEQDAAEFAEMEGIANHLEASANQLEQQEQEQEEQARCKGVYDASSTNDVWLDQRLTHDTLQALGHQPSNGINGIKQEAQAYTTEHTGHLLDCGIKQESAVHTTDLDWNTLLNFGTVAGIATKQEPAFPMPTKASPTCCTAVKRERGTTALLDTDFDELTLPTPPPPTATPASTNTNTRPDLCRLARLTMKPASLTAQANQYAEKAAAGCGFTSTCTQCYRTQTPSEELRCLRRNRNSRAAVRGIICSACHKKQPDRTECWTRIPQGKLPTLERAARIKTIADVSKFLLEVVPGANIKKSNDFKRRYLFDAETNRVCAIVRYQTLSPLLHKRLLNYKHVDTVIVVHAKDSAKSAVFHFEDDQVLFDANGIAKAGQQPPCCRLYDHCGEHCEH